MASLDIDVLKVAVPGVLPLRLLQLTGTVVNKKTVLKWRTAQEQNTAGFEVQHSIDGGSFLTIGSVLASGNNAAGKSYQFTDGNPVAGINYYRLKIVDRDGSCTYSAVVKLKADENSQLQLYPNPATGDYLTATGVFNGGNPQAYSIYSATGVKVKEGNLGQATQKISLARLAKGYYTIRLSNGQTGRIIRQ